MREYSKTIFRSIKKQKTFKVNSSVSTDSGRKMSQQASEVLEETADAVKTGSPLERETITRLSSKMMRYKREITMTCNKTEIILQI